MKAALYARVSTGEQSVDHQLLALRGWAERLGVEVVAEYTDTASGSRSDRQALKRLLADAHRRQFDTVLVWALDRLSREGISAMLRYLERLKAAGVSVKSYTESWLDTGSAMSDLLLAIFAWVAQQERCRIAERVKSGLERARKRGKVLGRQRGQPVADETILALVRSGGGVRQTARALGISPATVSRVTSRERGRVLQDISLETVKVAAVSG